MYGLLMSVSTAWAAWHYADNFLLHPRPLQCVLHAISHNPSHSRLLLHSRLFCKTFCKAHGSWSEGRVSFLCDEWSVQIVGQMNRSNELFMHWQIFSVLCSWWFIGCAEKNHLLMIITCKERFYESNHGIIPTLLITSSCWESQADDEWEAHKRPSLRGNKQQTSEAGWRH